MDGLERLSEFITLHELDCRCTHHSLEHEHSVFSGWDEQDNPLNIPAYAPCMIPWCDCKKYKQVTPLELCEIIEREFP